VGALCDFVRRTQPLVELDALLRDAEAALDARWAKVEVPRWQRGGADAGAPAAEPTSAGEGGGGDADVGAFASAEALEAGVSAEQLKRELQARGLKCGGRVAERAQRLWLALHDPTQLDKRARATAATAAPAGGGGSTTGAAPDAHARKCASLEAALGALAPLVREAVADTCAHVEKAAARTYEEIEADLLAGEAGLEGAEGDDSDDDDGAAPVYNPKNLPLGWDGKPIPFWLYKLHGLNLEFKCEICGGASYWGPREFERHFQEARHAHSMRCLGIANTKAFHGITQIDQAYALQKTLDNDTRQKRFVAELDEEYEDSLGNVMPKKTYEDLARQGLL
jgi:splicing factor 3A subunit 3